RIPLKCRMPVTTCPIDSPVCVAPTRRAWTATAHALFVLTKPRLACMSVFTAMVAYGTVAPAAGSALTTFFGTTLAAGGALSLNQWWERRADAHMRRTRDRPLPRAQLTPAFALGWSLGLSVAG